MAKGFFSLWRRQGHAVVDPALPERLKREVLTASPEPLRARLRGDGPHSQPPPQRGPLRSAALLRKLAGLLPAAVPLGLIWYNFGNSGLQQMKDISHKIGVAGAAVAALAVVLLLLVAGGSGVRWVRNRRTNRRLWRIRDRVVFPADLTRDARALLDRALLAARSVANSTVQQEQLIDHRRNELELPVQEWEIASALLEYSRFVQEIPAGAGGSQARELLASRRRLLSTGLAGIERRVSALEAYAAQTAIADARYADWQLISHLGGGRERLLDFLARTAADEHAASGIHGMADEATAVASAFSSALDSAKTAALDALPQPA